MPVFVARQPVFDRKRTPCAYELLFRDGLDNALVEADGTAATSQVMTNSVLLFGIQTLTEGKKAFINVTRDILLKGHVQLLPKEIVVPQILRSVAPEPEVLAACCGLKRRGFEIALDDLGSAAERMPFQELADTVTVDFLETDETQQREIAEQLRERGLTLLAKKVEDYETFVRALDLGYDCFQGFFFAKPQTLSRNEIPGTKHHYLDLIREINRPSLNYDELHDVIKRDPGLAVRLLKYLNSAYFALQVEVRSIQHALVLLGEKEIRKWATLISLAATGEDKPSALLVAALTRARFFELLAPTVEREDEAGDLFLMGLLSLLDALVDRPLDECLKDMPIAKDITQALLGRPGPTRDILELALLYEKASWGGLGRTAQRLGFSESRIPEIHLAAVRWARETFGAAVGVGAGT